MKTVKAAPGAKRLIDSLRNMGYDCSTAVADLVDNSIAAQASEVHVEIGAQHGSRPAAIVIADNGRGMDRERLIEAMRFGAFQEYSAEDLGKYGLGLKTASLSQCRVLTVSAKAKPTAGSKSRRNYARWDLDHVDKSDEWELLLPGSQDLARWELDSLTDPASEDHGTVVVWTELGEALPLLSSHDVQRRDRYLAKLIDEVGNHLRMVFHRFMQGIVPGRRRLRLHLNGVELKAWDPFCREESTRELDIIVPTIAAQGPNGRESAGKIIIQPFILPREDEFSSAISWKQASGPRNWNQQQGFYFYRNHRLLQAGGWSWLRAVDEHTKLLRVAVDFPRQLDRSFSINITKMRARIPAEIRDTVSGAVSKWAKVARERYDRRPVKVAAATSRQSTVREASPAPAAKRSEAPPTINIGSLSFSLSNAPNHSLTVAEGRTQGQLRVIVPHGHELAGIFSVAKDDSGEMRRLCMAMLSLLEAVYEGRMEAESIPIQSLKRAFGRVK
jgi:hypothetical protein